MKRIGLLRDIPPGKKSVFFIFFITLLFLAKGISKETASKKIQESEEIANIYAALKSQSGDVRMRAIEIIKANPSRFQISRLKPLLEDKDNNVKLHAATVLAMNQDKSGQEYLRTLASRKVVIPDAPTVVERVKYFSAQNLKIKGIMAIGETRDTASIQTLLDLTKSDDPRVVDAAWMALARMGNKKGADVFVSGLKSSDPSARAKSAEVLGDLRVAEAGYQLRGRLKDWNQDVKLSAIKSLGKLKDRESLPSLRDFLATAKEQSIREAAAKSIGLIGDKTSVEFLKKFVDDENGVVRLSVCESLAILGDFSGKDFIIANIKKATEKEIRYRALRVLVYFDLTKSDIVLLEELKKDPDEMMVLEASNVLLQ